MWSVADAKLHTWFDPFAWTRHVCAFNELKNKNARHNNHQQRRRPHWKFEHEKPAHEYRVRQMESTMGREKRLNESAARSRFDRCLHTQNDLTVKTINAQLRRVECCYRYACRTRAANQTACVGRALFSHGWLAFAAAAIVFNRTSNFNSVAVCSGSVAHRQFQLAIVHSKLHNKCCST